MRHTRTFLSIFPSLLLVLLMVAPASSAPSLRLGANANYQLSVNIRTSSSCNGTPLNYSSIICITSPPPPPPPSSPPIVTIFNSGTCSPINSNCRFVPPIISINQGATVTWINNGTANYHTVTSNSTLNPSLPSFDSGAISPGGSFSYTFSTSGSYYYYCRFHLWLKGQVIALRAVAVAAITQPPTMPEFNVTGPVSWTIVGLNSNVALLNVTHQLSVSTEVAGSTVTPVSESGSVEESIDLATRVESPGTATSLVQELVRLYSTAITGALTYPSSSLAGLSILQMPDKPMYTVWWVNGPLTMGQPVLVLTGYSSVRGEDILTLGRDIGTRNAWVVGSQVSQSFSTIAPNGMVNANTKLSLQFEYDKTTDLMLKSFDKANVTVTMQTFYPPGQTFCGPNFCTQATVPVTVTRQMQATLTISLQLASTNIPLTSRAHSPTSNQNPPTSNQNPPTSNPPPSTTSPTQAAASPSVLYGAAGAVALAVVGIGVWLALRSPLRKSRAPLRTPEPMPTV